MGQGINRLRQAMYNRIRAAWKGPLFPIRRCLAANQYSMGDFRMADKQNAENTRFPRAISEWRIKRTRIPLYAALDELHGVASENGQDCRRTDTSPKGRAAQNRA